MAEYADREHYIPMRRTELAEMLEADPGLLPADRDAFRRFCQLITAVFHFEYHRNLEQIKDLYAPFDPDADTRPLAPPPAAVREQALDELFQQFSHLMERANFQRLTREQILAATQGESGAFGINMDVDLEVFERLDVFWRGDEEITRSRRPWWRLWFEQVRKFAAYQRLVMIFKLRQHSRLDADIDVSDVYLKIFKNIPKMDVDMLMPGARVQLTRIDRGLIVYPLIAGACLILYNIVRDLGVDAWKAVFSVGAATALVAGIGAKVASWTMAAAFGGYGYKSYYSFQVKRQNYTLRLTRSLYYQSLDNNAGVFIRLLDEAEEQECREVYLSYFCLWKHAPAEGWTAAELDDHIEAELERRTGLKVDFEIDDALAKLERHGIVTRNGDRYQAVPIDQALARLDATWDGYFQYPATA